MGVDPNEWRKWETPDQKRARRKQERLGGVLCIVVGLVMIAQSYVAVRRDGLGAMILSTGHGDVDLPWWIVGPGGVLAVAAGLFGLFNGR